jgi:hypothetical protein
MNNHEQNWQKLVEAARRTPPPTDPAKPPPPGFANRILNLRESIVSLARVMFWRRWSVLAAFLCLAIFLAILIAHQCSATRAPLIETPEPPPTQNLIR